MKNRPAVELCGGRNETYDSFRIALKAGNPTVLPLLLVDAEEAVAEGRIAWQHLEARDGWKRPPNATDNQTTCRLECLIILVKSTPIGNLIGPNPRVVCANLTLFADL